MTLQDRLTAYGCSQNDGKHYESSLFHAPITMNLHYTYNNIKVQLRNTSNGCEGCILEWLQDGKMIYMRVPKGFKKCYDKDEVSLLHGLLDDMLNEL